MPEIRNGFFVPLSRDCRFHTTHYFFWQRERGWRNPCNSLWWWVVLQQVPAVHPELLLLLVVCWRVDWLVWFGFSLPTIGCRPLCLFGAGSFCSLVAAGASFVMILVAIEPFVRTTRVCIGVQSVLVSDRRLEFRFVLFRCLRIGLRLVSFVPRSRKELATRGLALGPVRSRLLQPRREGTPSRTGRASPACTDGRGRPRSPKPRARPGSQAKRTAFASFAGGRNPRRVPWVRRRPRRHRTQFPQRPPSERRRRRSRWGARSTPASLPLLPPLAKTASVGRCRRRLFVPWISAGASPGDRWRDERRCCPPESPPRPPSTESVRRGS
mmetsp:Transcript_28041/g.60092  ORF Transcript_28041/g.60092 Transcript_28041/m.60092 type:complete len:326 (+) Transcript_28041:3123-4100(+)